MMDQSIVVGDGAGDGGDEKDEGYKPPQNLLGDIDDDDGADVKRQRSGTLALNAAEDLMGANNAASTEQI